VALTQEQRRLEIRHYFVLTVNDITNRLIYFINKIDTHWWEGFTQMKNCCSLDEPLATWVTSHQTHNLVMFHSV